MPDFDRGFKTVARTAGLQLARVAGYPCTRWAPIVSEVQAVERLADRAFRAGRGRENFVVYMEAYTYWDAAAPWSILAKSGLLSERERLPTLSLVFILRPRGYRPQQGQFRLQVAGQTRQQVQFEEVCLWEQQPQSWWEQTPGLMTLYPLCRHGQQPAAAVTHAAEAIEYEVREKPARADLLSILGIFGKLVYPGFDVVGLIGREKMKESPFFEEVMAEGRVEKGRANILAVLEERFGAAPAEVSEAVNALTDEQQLDQLHRLAVRCSNIDVFRQALEAARPRRRRRRQSGGK